MRARNHRCGRATGLVATAVAIGLVLAPQAVAQASSLDGETFTTTTTEANQSRDDMTCSWQDGRIVFSLSGTATGPYTGTYREQGEITFDPYGGTDETDYAMPVTGFQATFTIEDASGTQVVEGQKYFADGTTGLVDCPGPLFEDFESRGSITGLGYAATLPGGATDEGTSDVSWDWSFTERWAGSFTQTFTSGGAPPPPPPPAQPTDKKQCKNGGYLVYGYSSQGRCVASVVIPAFKGPGKK